MKSPADMKIIQIEITNACPKRCSNCTRFCGHHVKPFFMDFETFKRAVDSMQGFDGIVGIMGGEPTIHPEFDKFVRYFRESFGYDDFSTACYKPSSNFVNHILANSYHTGYSNQRGLWTSVTTKYYEHFELIQDTFGYQLVNDHSNPSMHTTLMATRKELGIPDDEWIKMRDNCWVQNLWSASITPKGAFFCEVAGALDILFDGPGGWPIEPGWWKRKPVEFKDQLHWCEMCSAALPMPKRDARQEVDDVSPVWKEKLVQIESPKAKKGLAQEFDPNCYNPEDHEIIHEITPYMEDQELRIGTAREILVPHRICSVAWFTDQSSCEDARRTVETLRAAGRLDFILSASPAHRQVAETAGIPFIDAAGRTGTELYDETRKRGNVRDWVLLMRDGAPSTVQLEVLRSCVFNTGCVYSNRRRKDGSTFGFFNIRASSLAKGGDLFNIAATYPKRKVVTLNGKDASQYALGDAGVFYRRAVKRIHWAKKRVGLKLGVVEATTV